MFLLFQFEDKNFTVLLREIRTKENTCKVAKHCFYGLYLLGGWEEGESDVSVCGVSI